MSVGTIPGVQAARSRAAAPATAGRAAMLAVAALSVLGAALRFYRLGHQGFWFDEANTVLLVHFSPGKMIGLIPQTESTPPLYYCVAWVWVRVFGYGEAGLRSLSAVCGVLSVPVAFAAARKLVSERAGVFAAALVACNGFLIWYSQEARSYSMLVLLTTVALLAFAYVRDDPRPRTAAVWAIACALALATHYFAVVAVIPQAIWLLVVHRRSRAVQAGLAVVVLCGLALIPLALSQNGTGHDSWIAHTPLGERIGQIWPQLVIGTNAPAYAVLQPVAAAMVLIGLALLVARVVGEQRDGVGGGRWSFAGRPEVSGGRLGVRAAAVGLLAVGGLALALALVAGGSDNLITRNLIVLFVPFLIAVATGFAYSRPSVIGIVAAAVLCAVGVAAAVGIARDRNLQRPDWRGVARVLGPRPAPGVDERVVLIQHYRDLLPLSLYLPGLEFWRNHQPQDVREFDVITMGSPQEDLCWWGAACNLIPSQMQARYPIRGFHKAWLRNVWKIRTGAQFEVMRLVASRPTAVTPAEVARVLHTTSLRRDDLLLQR